MAFWTLYKRETSSYFISPIAYVVFSACSFCLGATFATSFNLLNIYNITQYSVLQFSLNFYFWLALIVQIPIITMRTFSEEFKMGTMETLLTAPVREIEVVLAKYFGALTFFVVLWTPMFVNLLYLHFFTMPRVPISWGPTGMTFLAIFLLGMFYTSVGVFTSVLTRNQIVAAILSFVLIFGCFSLSMLPFFRLDVLHPSVAGISLGTINLPVIVSYVSALEQMSTMSRGIFDSRPVVLSLTATILMLFLTLRFLQARRLQG